MGKALICLLLGVALSAQVPGQAASAVDYISFGQDKVKLPVLSTPSAEERSAALALINSKFSKEKASMQMPALVHLLRDPDLSTCIATLRLWEQWTSLESDLYEMALEEEEAPPWSREEFALLLATEMERLTDSRNQDISFAAFHALARLSEPSDFVFVRGYGCGVGLLERVAGRAGNVLGRRLSTHAEVMRRLVEDPDPGVAMNALLSLSAEQRLPFRPVMVRMLGSQDPHFRTLAAWLFPSTSSNDLMNTLGPVAEDTDWRVAEAAAEKLAKGIADFKDLFARRKDLRTGIKYGLACKLSARNPAEKLMLQELCREENARVRLVCLTEFAQANTPWEEYLVLGLLTDPEPQIRASAIRFLRPENSNMPFLLTRALRDPDESVRLAALQINSLDNWADIRAAVRAVELSSAGGFEAGSLSSLLERPENLDVLKECIASRYEFVRSAAAEALGRKAEEDHGALEELLRMAGDPSADVRSEVIRWIPFEDQEGVRVLVSLAAKANTADLIRILETVAKSSYREALPFITKHLQHRKRRVRMAAEEARKEILAGRPPA